MKALNKRTLMAVLKRWRADPVLFCREVLGFDPWSKQQELLYAARDSHYVACRSGHKCGKTTALAALALWYVTVHERSRVVMTAPAAQQIERGLWAEFKRLYREAEKRGMGIGGTLNETPHTGWIASDGRDVFGRSTNVKENFAGISAPNLLILVDEASGIDEEIFEAIFGNLGGNGRLVLISNPTQLSGRFYEAFHGKRAHWKLVHISSEDTPNFHGQKVDGLAHPAWAAMMKDEWGYPSIHYDVRVLGNFPRQAENSVIGFGLVEDAINRGKELAPDTSPLEIGIDVARFGDDATVFVPVRGRTLFPPKVLRSFDIVDVAGHAHAFARELSGFAEVPLLRVDANGLGSGVADHLRRREHVRVADVNVSERARAADKYFKCRDEVWFGMRKWLEQGGCLPDDGRLSAELIAPTYSFDVKGRYVVESKSDIKVRLGRSPDVADAACLAVYRVGRSAGASVHELRKRLKGRRM
jgi:phage terminase large subunit